MKKIVLLFLLLSLALCAGITSAEDTAAAVQAIFPDNDTYRKILIYEEGLTKPVPGYIVSDESVLLRIEIGSDDDAANLMYMDPVSENRLSVAGLFDPERNGFVYDQFLAFTDSGVHYIQVTLLDKNLREFRPDKDAAILLVRGEEYIDEMINDLNERGAAIIRWEYADSESQQEPSDLQAYVIHVVDQDNNPVPEVAVYFCTDLACIPQETDENGTIFFTGAPNQYHVQIIDVPDGYSYDEDFEMSTTPEYGEWTLHVQRDI